MGAGQLLYIILSLFVFAWEKNRKFAVETEEFTMDKANNPSTPSQKLLADYLRSHKRRCTPERFMILEAAEGMKGHFSVRDLCGAIEASGTHIAPATVYSTVGCLSDCGLLRALHIDGDAVRYEVSDKAHNHLVCTVCGKVKDMVDPELSELLRARRYSAFTASFYTLTVFGVCSACARRRRRASQENNTKSESVISRKKK